jgi:high-affinity iron transporter
LFAATLRLPVYYAFRLTSVLLILFAGGLLAHGIHEFAQVGLLPEIGKTTLAFIPEKASFAGQMLQAIFGLTKTMDMVQMTVYAAYVGFMGWWVFFRKRHTAAQPE